MRISNIYGLQGPARPTNVVSRTKTDRAARAADTFQPSNLVTSFNLARRAVADVPEIRADRVNDILERIRAGEYHISVADVASKMVDQLG